MSNLSKVKKSRGTKLAVVLAGGGIRGLAHIGVLEVLTQAGMVPDLIVGCSAGAIVGALYAAKKDIAHTQKIGLEMAPYPKNYHLFGLPSMYKGLRGYGFFSMKRTQNFLSKVLQARTFEDLQIPLAVVATNLNKGVSTTFSKGPLAEAVCASACIPGIFQPVVIKDQYYVDGYISAQLPIFVAKEWGAQFTLAVNICDHIDPNISAKKIFNVVVRSVNIMSMHHIKDMTVEADLVIDPGFVEAGNLLANYKHALHLYEAGKRAATKILPTLQKRLAALGIAPPQEDLKK